jgi:DNA polymerase III subunit delta
MLIFIYGPDSYSSRQKMAELVNRQKKKSKSGLIAEILEDDSLTIEKLKGALGGRSLFGEEKIVILKNIFSSKDFKDNFLEKGEELAKAETCILIFEEGDPDKREALLKFLQKKAECFEFQPLGGNELGKWVSDEFARYGQKINPKAQDKLVIFAKTDLWLLSNEIKKLSGFCHGRAVNEKDVDLLVIQKIENDIFKTIEALAQNNKKEALRLLHNHMSQGDAPEYLLSMICFQFRNLLEIRDLIEKKISYAEACKKSALHPFVIKKTWWAAQKFNLLQLKKIYRKILQADLFMKTGKIEPETSLDLLVSGL